MLEPHYNLGVWGIPDWMYKNQKNWIYSVWCETSYVKNPVPYTSVPVWMMTVCAGISVDKRLNSVCKNNCCFLLPDASSLRLLSYRHLLATLPNSLPYVIINTVRSWAAKKLVRLHQRTQSPPEHRFSLCICHFFIPLPPLVVFPGPKSHRMRPRVECDFVPQEWICKQAHYQWVEQEWWDFKIFKAFRSLGSCIGTFSSHEWTWPWNQFWICLLEFLSLHFWHMLLECHWQ